VSELKANDYGLIFAALRTAQQAGVPRDILHNDIEAALVALERIRSSLAATVLNVQPGDVLVCKAGSPCDLKAFADFVRPLFPNNKVMIVPVDYSFEIIRPAVVADPAAIVGDM
jgi:hypothetical protein